MRPTLLEADLARGQPRSRPISSIPTSLDIDLARGRPHSGQGTGRTRTTRGQIYSTPISLEADLGQGRSWSMPTSFELEDDLNPIGQSSSRAFRNMFKCPNPPSRGPETQFPACASPRERPHPSPKNESGSSFPEDAPIESRKCPHGTEQVPSFPKHVWASKFDHFPPPNAIFSALQHEGVGSY